MIGPTIINSLAIIVLAATCIRDTYVVKALRLRIEALEAKERERL